jgi:hypothetical protein
MKDYLKHLFYVQRTTKMGIWESRMSMKLHCMVTC